MRMNRILITWLLPTITVIVTIGTALAGPMPQTARPTEKALLTHLTAAEVERIGGFTGIKTETGRQRMA